MKNERMLFYVELALLRHLGAQVFIDQSCSLYLMNALPFGHFFFSPRMRRVPLTFVWRQWAADFMLDLADVL